MITFFGCQESRKNYEESLFVNLNLMFLQNNRENLKIKFNPEEYLQLCKM